MLHADLIQRVGAAAESFRVLVLKTTGTVPYSSVFVELELDAHWNTPTATATWRTTSPHALARAIRIGCRLTPQFSSGALPYVPWHFIHDRLLQLLVRRLLGAFHERLTQRS